MHSHVFTCSHGQVNMLISKEKGLISVFAVAVICLGKWFLCNSYRLLHAKSVTFRILQKYSYMIAVIIMDNTNSNDDDNDNDNSNNHLL